MKAKTLVTLCLLAFLFCQTSCGTLKENAKNEASNIDQVLKRFALVEDSLKISSGKIQRYYAKSINVDSRNVDIWLPKNYDSKNKYAVLYMHDGQMLYDPSGSWNNAEWTVDETLTKLVAEKKIKDVIVVGIWHNSNKRHLEYFPQAAIDSIDAPQHDILLGLMPEKPQGDLYLKFIVEELKPFVDNTFSVHTDIKNTFVAGSSMGGLISMYAICEYPQIFGGAACISTHWIGTFDNNKEIPAGIQKYLKNKLPNPKNHLIYFDNGTIGLDSNYPEHQQAVDKIMINKGYTNKNWMSKEFEGADHREKDWSARLHIPFTFLLKK